MHRHFEIKDLQSSGLRLFSAARPLPKHHQARRLPARVDRAGHLVRVRVRFRIRVRVGVRARARVSPDPHPDPNPNPDPNQRTGESSITWRPAFSAIWAISAA